MEICLPIQFVKKTAKTTASDATITVVNNFFGHWFTSIDVRRYPDDLNILPTNNSVSVANYSNAQMKYLPLKSVKKLLKTMLYSNKPVYLTSNNDRRPNNDNTAANRTDPNLTYRIKELADTLKAQTIYRVPLLYFCDLGKVNFSTNTDTRIKINLERNMNKLFESNAKVSSIPDNPDAFINFFFKALYRLSRNNVNSTGVSLPKWHSKIKDSLKTRCFTCSFPTRV